MSTHNTLSKGLVNSPPSQISTKEDLFLSIGIDLGFRGLAIMRAISYHCAMQGGDSCRISQKTLGIHSKSSVTTVKERLTVAIECGLVKKENIFPGWHKDENGKRVFDWATNLYTPTEFGKAFLGVFKMDEKPQASQGFTYKCPTNTWDRSKRKEPTARTQKIKDLQQKVEEELYVATKLATIPKDIRNKKGEFVSHEEKLNGRGVGDRGRTSTGDCQPSDRTSDRQCAIERGTNDGQDSGTNQTEDISHGQERRIEDHEPGRTGSNHKRREDTYRRSAANNSGDAERVERERLRKPTVLDSINYHVSEMVDRDPHVFGLIPAKVRGLIRRDNVNLHAILATLKELLEWKIVHWKFKFDIILDKHNGKEKQLAREREVREKRRLEAKVEYERLEAEKQNRTGTIDLQGMMKNWKVSSNSSA